MEPDYPHPTSALSSRYSLLLPPSCGCPRIGRNSADSVNSARVCALWVPSSILQPRSPPVRQRAKIRARDTIAARSPVPPPRANRAVGGSSVTNPLEYGRDRLSRKGGQGWSASHPARPGGGRLQEPCNLTVKLRVRDRDWIFPRRPNDPRDIRAAVCLDVPISVLHRMLRRERIWHHRLHPTPEPASDSVRSPALNLPPRCWLAASPHGAWDRPFSGGPAGSKPAAIATGASDQRVAVSAPAGISVRETSFRGKIRT